MGFLFIFNQCHGYMLGMESDQFILIPYGQGESRVIVNTPFNDSIEIGKGIVDFVRYLCDDTDLFWISQTRESTGNFV
jgi:hypothetical protein